MVLETFSHWFATESKSTNPQLIANATVLRALLLLEFGPVESWHLKIKADNTEVSSYTVKSVSAAEFQEQGGTTAFGRKNSCQYFHEYNAVLLRINSFGGHLANFEEFLREVFQEIHDKSVHNLIVDVRKNPGGSDMNADALLEYLTAKPYRQFEKAQIKLSSQDEQGIAPLRKQSPGLFEDKKIGDFITLELPLKTPPENPMRFEGKTFVLIGPHSFSTTTSFASTVKCFGIGKLIGEETGDPTVLYGNAIDDRLPNTGLTVAVAGRAFVLAGGKPDGHGVIPDYEVKQKPEDTAKGVDAVLQFTLDLIKRSSNKADSTPDK